MCSFSGIHCGPSAKGGASKPPLRRPGIRYAPRARLHRGGLSVRIGPSAVARQRVALSGREAAVRSGVHMSGRRRRRKHGASTPSGRPHRPTCEHSERGALETPEQPGEEAARGGRPAVARAPLPGRHRPSHAVDVLAATGPCRLPALVALGRSAHEFFQSLFPRQYQIPQGVYFSDKLDRWARRWRAGIPPLRNGLPEPVSRSRRREQADASEHH